MTLLKRHGWFPLRWLKAGAVLAWLWLVLIAGQSMAQEEKESSDNQGDGVKIVVQQDEKAADAGVSSASDKTEQPVVNAAEGKKGAKRRVQRTKRDSKGKQADAGAADEPGAPEDAGAPVTPVPNAPVDESKAASQAQGPAAPTDSKVDDAFVGPVLSPRSGPATATNVAPSRVVPAPGAPNKTEPLQQPEAGPTAGLAGAVTSTVPGTSGPVSSAPPAGGVAPTAPPVTPPAQTPGKTESGPDFPAFAENQPGVVPEEKKPEELLKSPPPTEIEFNSQLGESKLPTQDSQTLILNQAGSPGIELQQNYARIVVPTGTISGSTEIKQFHIEGGLQMYYNSVLITGDTADIDEKQEIAVITGNVSIEDPKYSLKTDELRIKFGDKDFEATGFVQFRKELEPKKSEPDMSRDKKSRVREYLAGQQLELYCGKLFYNWGSKEMTALEGVRLVHPAFNGTMERMDYNDETKVYEMSDSVELEVTNYDWMFKTKMVDDKDEKKMRALTDGSTKVTCDRMQYSEETSIAMFFANSGNLVSFEQPKRKVTGIYIEVNDDTKDFYAEGAAETPATYTQQDGEWLYQAELLKKEDTAQDMQNALQGQLTATASTLTYNYDRKRVEMRGGVRIEGSGTVIQAGELVQDETAKFFLLKDNVLIQPNADSEVHAAQVYVDTANDVITFVGMVQGKAKSDEVPSAKTAAEGEAGQQGEGQGVQPGVFRQGGLPGQIPGRANVAEGG